jgi:Flp pilus assembly protein TadG
MSKSRWEDNGATAVEFALVALIILIIGLGAVDFGLWMFQK